MNNNTEEINLRKFVTDYLCLGVLKDDIQERTIMELVEFSINESLNAISNSPKIENFKELRDIFLNKIFLVG